MAPPVRHFSVDAVTTKVAVEAAAIGVVVAVETTRAEVAVQVTLHSSRVVRQLLEMALRLVEQSTHLPLQEEFRRGRLWPIVAAPVVQTLRMV
jgi:hypothetical protein